MCPLCREPLGAVKVALAEGGYAHRACCDARARQRRHEAIRDLVAVIATAVILGVIGGAPSTIISFAVMILLHRSAHPAWWRNR